MKQTPQWDMIQENMKPGGLSRDGFLGSDMRKLIDIIDQDQQTVAAHELSNESISEVMEYITMLGKVGFGNPIRVDDRFIVMVEDSRGQIPCPFGHKGLYPKENVRVTNIRTGEEIRWSALNIHLIAEHGFFEGLGSPFRISPEDLIRVLEIEP